MLGLLVLAPRVLDDWRENFLKIRSGTLTSNCILNRLGFHIGAQQLGSAIHAATVANMDALARAALDHHDRLAADRAREDGARRRKRVEALARHRTRPSPHYIAGRHVAGTEERRRHIELGCPGSRPASPPKSARGARAAVSLQIALPTPEARRGPRPPSAPAVLSPDGRAKNRKRAPPAAALERATSAGERGAAPPASRPPSAAARRGAAPPAWVGDGTPEPFLAATGATYISLTRPAAPPPDDGAAPAAGRDAGTFRVADADARAASAPGRPRPPDRRRGAPVNRAAYREVTRTALELPASVGRPPGPDARDPRAFRAAALDRARREPRRASWKPCAWARVSRWDDAPASTRSAGGAGGRDAALSSPGCDESRSDGPAPRHPAARPGLT